MKEIDKLMRDCKDEQLKRILRQLKGLNVKAQRFMMGENQTFGPKYRNLQKTHIWTSAKQTIIMYLIHLNKFKCPICNTRLNFQRCTLHHSELYNIVELFTPSLVQIIHNGCHSDFHRK